MALDPSYLAREVRHEVGLQAQAQGHKVIHEDRRTCDLDASYRLDQQDVEGDHCTVGDLGELRGDLVDEVLASVLQSYEVTVRDA